MGPLVHTFNGSDNFMDKLNHETGKTGGGGAGLNDTLMASFKKIIISKSKGFEFFTIELNNEVPALPHCVAVCTVEIVNHRMNLDEI